MNQQALSSFLWSVADLLRGDYKQADYGKVILPFTVLRRIWLPRAVHRALPTLTGEMVLQLKATPLVATITVVDVFAVFSRVRQDTYLVYEPLLLLALIYLCLTAVLVFIFRYVENLVPNRTA